MVLKTQQYLNKNYSGKSGYNTIAEDGATGWSTIYALTRALQIELGLSAPADNFGNASANAFKQKYPSGIKEQEAGAEETSRVYAIIQGALWCKGYGTGAYSITEHFYGGTGSAIKRLKKDAGFEDPDSTVTLNVMKALLSMDQFVLIHGQDASNQIRVIQQCLNRDYEQYIGLIPCDGLYGRSMNKALIKVLQVIEGLTPDGVFGNGTKAKCPELPDTTGKLSADTAEAATRLVKYSLSCNGYLVYLSSSEWDTNLESLVKQFQTDLHLPITGKADTNTWMSLLLSKGNPDRSCTACDTRFEITDKRADELRRKGYSIVGRHLTGTEFKVLRDKEPKRILDKGLNFFPIFQESSTNVTYFTEERGKTDADKAVRAARKFKIPEGNVIYFAVDLDATGPQISKYIKPYFKALSENIDTAYKVGIYGTRNVCTQICAENYAVTCFVSDMSTGYSGNMGFKMPNTWNFDQYSEISMGNGDWAIDKDAYAERFEPVKELEQYVYVKPEPPLTEGLPTITEVLPSIERLEKLYVDYYATLVQAQPNVFPPITPRILATGITVFFRSITYTGPMWAAAMLQSIDEDFVNYVKKHDMDLYDILYDYIKKEDNVQVSDEHGGVVDLRHLAATTEGYFSLTSAPTFWIGWGGDLATAMANVDQFLKEYNGDYQAAADAIIGHNNTYNFPYADICTDADSIMLAEIILESESKTNSYSESIRIYYKDYVKDRYKYYFKDLKCQPNLTAMKTALSDMMRGLFESTILKPVLGKFPSAASEHACCMAFANYIYNSL